MLPEKLSIGLPSMKRPPNGADEVVASLHVSCIFPSRAFRAARIVPERGQRPGAAERRARGNSNEAQLAGRLPGVLERPAEAVDVVAARPAAVVAVVFVNAVLLAKPSFVTAHDCSGIESLNLRSLRLDRQLGGEAGLQAVRNRLLPGLLPSSMTASARWQLGSARAPTPFPRRPPPRCHRGTWLSISPGGPHPWPRPRS
jgi:hypothetical protein